MKNALTAEPSSGRIRTVMKRRPVISALYASFSRLWTLTKSFVVCALAVLCLAAAGSDGPYFPWPNMAGLAVLTVIVVLFGKRHPHP